MKEEKKMFFRRLDLINKKALCASITVHSSDWRASQNWILECSFECKKGILNFFEKWVKCRIDWIKSMSIEHNFFCFTFTFCVKIQFTLFLLVLSNSEAFIIHNTTTVPWKINYNGIKAGFVWGFVDFLMRLK